ncbi:rna-directed dna polymerase from mobile element jockey-like [Pitangus sulphuratus]|nr:rna-directed dna polymerase from mobile element jockey-like [Pitangus sulphuratus]
MDNGIQCTFSKFVEDIKLSDAVNIVEGRDAIQRDFNMLVRLAHEVQQSKFKVLYLCCDNPRHTHGWVDKCIESSPAEKDLGLMVDEKLNMWWQCVLTAQKAN